MSILTRAKQLIFGDTGGTGEFGQIGSKAAGSPVTTKNLATIQALTEYLQGLNAIVSDQGTSVLPYLEDMNSLFFLTTSQLAYLFQSGVPEWETGTDYYAGVSFVQDEGIIWRSITGVDPTPNQGNKPSTNLDKWEPVAAPTELQTISASGALTLGYKHYKVEIDISGGDVSISALPVPSFKGQKLHVYAQGSTTNIADIAGGNGVYSGGIFITANTGGAHLEAVSIGGSLEWKPINEITADYTDGTLNYGGGDYWKIKMMADGTMEISFLRTLAINSVQTFVFPRQFNNNNDDIDIADSVGLIDGAPGLRNEQVSVSLGSTNTSSATDRHQQFRTQVTGSVGNTPRISVKFTGHY